MTYSVFVNLLNQQLNGVNECSLNSLEIIILQGILEDLTYSKIGQEQGYSVDYLTNVAAPKLYKKLSKLIGKSIKKKIVVHY